MGQTIYTNPDKSHVEKIDKALESNVKKYGEAYCPCTTIHDKDHICPCKEFMESTVNGKCHCGKYIKEVD